jgi:tetratricopeptide (TPR) repeat protein
VYHYYRKEYQQAIEFLRKALRQAAELSQVDADYARRYLTLSHLGLAEREEARGNLKGHVDELRRAARNTPRWPDIHHRLALAYERQGRTPEAIEAFGKAIACHPEYLEARVALAFCLLRVGRMEEAAAAYEQALALKLELLERLFRTGMDQLRQGAGADAAQWFHETFRATPLLSQECLRKALDFMQSEEYEKALVELDRAMQINPRYPDLYNFRGIVLCELARFPEALDSFDRSVALASRSGQRAPRLNRAFALVRQGRTDDAIVELESILETEPDEPVARAKLEELRTGRPAERRAVPRGKAR